MNARGELFGLYEQWRAWTQAETEAIQQAIWNKVAQCQGEKHRLQAEILAATERWHEESRIDGGGRPEQDPQLRRVVDELILLEYKNSELVEEQRRIARRQQDETERSGRNLRQIQRAYALSREAIWESYS
jgi:hypothetical protein